jgi:16S rRNA (guanine527-N7)-methyltransferase
VTGQFEQAVRPRAEAAGIRLTAPQIRSLAGYYELLIKWARTINLTSLPLEGYPTQSIDRLIIEPLLAARFFPAHPFRWLDLGTGGGSPALPLKIIQPDGALEMIESRDRKAAFLREVVRLLELAHAQVRTSRIEDFAEAEPGSAVDLITMRAVRPALPILHAAAHLLKPDGRFLIFGSGHALNFPETTALHDAGLRSREAAPLLESTHVLHVLTR